MNWYIVLGFVLLVADVVILIGLDDTLQYFLGRPVFTRTEWLNWFCAAAITLLLFLVFPGLAAYLLAIGSGM